MKKRRVLMLALILFVVALAVYFSFFYAKKCSDSGCFNKLLADCRKAVYINEADEASWLYEIKDRVGEECKVHVKLLQLKKGNAQLSGLEGKDMDCYILFGTATNPSENLKKCHGLLKEELQEIIISKAHNYITENLGEIKEELKKTI